MTNETKQAAVAGHTPGPWHVTYDGTVKSASGTVADCIGIERVRMNNARLIAAAPDLLAALERAASALEYAAHLERNKKMIATLNQHATDARAALNKAKGAV